MSRPSDGRPRKRPEVWDPEKREWTREPFKAMSYQHKVPSKRFSRALLGLSLTALLILGTVFSVAAIVGEGGSGDQPARTAVTPSPSPTYKLPPDGQIMARAAFYDLSAGERAGMCAFFAELPKDAVRQAVDAGIRPADARALVNFIAKELCP